MESDLELEQYDSSPDNATASIPEEVSLAAYESQYGSGNPLDGNQQQFQPPPSTQPAQQYLQVNLQTTPTYSTQPEQFPPQNPQANPSTQPTQFPPQNPQTYTMYSTQPAQLPPQNPQTNPIYPSQPPPAGNYPPQVNPQSFPFQMPHSSLPANYPMYPNQTAQYPPPVYPNQPPPGNYPPQFYYPQTSQYPPPPPPLQFTPANYPPRIPGTQPYMGSGPPVTSYGRWNGGTQSWTTGLFDCMDDPNNALITACFPCVTFGQVAEIIDNGHTTCATSGLLYGAIAFLIGFPCLLSCTYRAKLRNAYGLVESPASDWITHFLCEWCALCQAYRELQNRGLDPSIERCLGWLGNVAKSQNAQHPQVAMVPPMNQTMTGA